MVFVLEMQGVYCEAGNEYLNAIQGNSSLRSVEVREVCGMQ
jgi:hypothetical protein